MDKAWFHFLLEPAPWLSREDFLRIPIPWVTLGFAGIIVVLLLWRGLSFSRKHRRLHQALKQVNDCLAPLQKGLTGEVLDQSIAPLFQQDADGLWETWQEFRESTVERDGRIWNTIQAEHFFTANSVFHELQTELASLPGLCTGIGLLGTFVAILLGLAELHVADSGQVEGIKQFINALAGKFGSSIIGLFGAIVAIALGHWWMKDLNRQLHRLVSELNRLFPRLTPERLLLEAVTALDRQKVALEALATDLSQKINQGVTETLTPELGKLLTAIDGLNASSRSLESLNTESMNRTIEAFQLLPEALAISMDRQLGQVLVQRIQEATDAIRAATQEATQRTESAMAHLPEGIGSVVERQLSEPVLVRLDSLGASLGKLESQNVEGFADALRNMTAEFREALKGATQTEFDSMGRTLAEATNLLQGMENRTQAQEEQLRRFLDDLHRGLADQQALFTQQAGRMNELVAGMAERVAGSSEASLSAFQDRIGELIASTQSWTEGLRTQFNRMTEDYSQSAAHEREQLGHHIGTLAQDLQAVVETLRTAQQNQVETLETSSRTLSERTRQETEALSHHFRETQSSLLAGAGSSFSEMQQAFESTTQRLLEGAQQRESQFQGLWQKVAHDQERLAGAFTQAGTELRSAMTELERHLSEQSRLSQTTQTTHQQLSNAASQINNGLKQFTEAQHGFQDGVDRNRQVLQDALGMLQALEKDRRLQKEVYDHLDEQLGTLLSRVGDSLKQYRDHVDATFRETLQHYHSAFNGSTKTLSDVVGGLSNMVQEFNDNAEGLRETLSESLGRNN